MKIIKRSGAEVAFDLSKIVAAIRKANESVKESERIPEKENIVFFLSVFRRMRLLRRWSGNARR